MGFIYKITSPSGKIYIGSTVDIKRRFRDYRALRCEGQIKLYNSFICHGVNNHCFEIITECNEVEILRLESFYGALYKSLHPTGLNLSLPKSEIVYSGLSVETKNKISEALKGKGHGEEWRKAASERQKLQKPMLGKKHSIEAKEKMSLAKIGKPNKAKGVKLTEEHKKKLSAAKIGKKYTEEHRKNMSVAQSKRQSELKNQKPK